MPTRNHDENRLLARPHVLGRLLRGILACIAFLFAGDAARGGELVLAAFGILSLTAAVL